MVIQADHYAMQNFSSLNSSMANNSSQQLNVHPDAK